MPKMGIARLTSTFRAPFVLIHSITGVYTDLRTGQLYEVRGVLSAS